MSIGKSSSLPAIILKVRTSFESEEKSAKFAAGPTPERPGPMLLMVAATAVKFVTRSRPSIVISSSETINTRITGGCIPPKAVLYLSK